MHLESDGNTLNIWNKMMKEYLENLTHCEHTEIEREIANKLHNEFV